VSAELPLAAALCVTLLAYLLYTLLRPERF
jgi:K+-transporting ATPase KdpF subunit